ncbi:MAG: hypothetical protein VB080_03665 [Propionicimonas sp.]|uniref:hypothetical protein n=1 Tax=Propionicimonas sp. TaxID=1955623 RepID=UPI002B209AB5|nr:hypothetical protein [Propionicimonas sp.]MEA4943515.1 hypothetical protein [Propionicimonas sp.]MEA5054824.1 hypothetical protein [Propionicimonas sp.]MEA5118882.1 hypothetical protein [Propionicimonas sp.]
MNQILAALDAAWRILVVGIVLGAILPTLFGFGIRALAWGTGGDAETHDEGVMPPPHPVGRWIAGAIFALVIVVVLLGLGYILAHGLGMTITFNGLMPVFTPKA